MKRKSFIALFLIFFSYHLGTGTVLGADDPQPNIDILAFHAQRYQNHTVNQIRCEVFGEIKNLSNRLLKNITVMIEFLDEKGAVVGKEEARILFRVIAPRNARGELRPVRPQEIGYFNHDTHQCPSKWLEGRIRYKVKNVEWE